jgi:hypothetical protein
MPARKFSRGLCLVPIACRGEKSVFALHSQLLGGGVCFSFVRIIVILGVVLLTFAGSVRAQETIFASQFETPYIFLFAWIAGLISLMLWDRRTKPKPVTEYQLSLSDRIAKLEHILKEYAKGEPRLAEILKQYALW